MNYGTQPAVDGRSGGKILKRRQITARKTPYDRPTPPLQHENPNWRNAIFVSGKFVAGGAGKLISSLWNPKSWGECSSSSSESDSDSGGGIEDDNEYDGNLHDDGTELNQNKCSSSGKSEILYLVEQLLMLDRFSREECDRLIKIMNSRLVDYTMGEEVDAGPDNPNVSSKVIMEARKMITENPRNYFSGGSWNIQNEVQRLHSKAIEFIKPKKIFALQAPNPGNETVNMASKDTRTTQDNVPTTTLSSLPIIKVRHQSAEKKELKDDKMGDDVNRVEGNSEYAEVADVILASEGSSNDPASTNETDSPSVKRAATRTRKHNTKRGRPRGK